MANVEQNQQGSGKIKKRNMNIDMTPMVDLGFLLITFFILTATMSTPSNLRLVVPKKADSPDQKAVVDSRGTLNIILDKDLVYVYSGTDFKTLKSYKTDLELRKAIIDKQTQTSKAGLSDKFVVVIKATDDAYYENVVNVLDEMLINEIPNYTLVDISIDEWGNVKNQSIVTSYK